MMAIRPLSAIQAKKVKVALNLFNLFLAVFCTITVIGCGAKHTTVNNYIHEDVGCATDADCDEDYGSNAVASCNLETSACRYVVTNTVTTPTCITDTDCNDGDPASADTCVADECTHTLTSGQAAVVTSFNARTFRVVTSPGNWQNLGELQVAAYSAAPQSVTAVTFFGANLNAFGGISLAETINGATTIIASTSPVSGSGTVEVPFNQSWTLVEGAPRTLQVWGYVNRAFFIEQASYDPTTTLSLLKVTLEDAGADSYIADEGHGSIKFRASMPSVLFQAINSTTISNQDQDLYKVQVVADLNGAIYLHSMSFRFISNTVNGSLSNFRIRSGSVDMSPSEYTVHRSLDGADITNVTTDFAPFGSILVTVSFTTPIAIVGSGRVFTLHATTGGFTSGEGVNVSFADRNAIDGNCDSIGRIVDPSNSNVAYIDSIAWDDGAHGSKCMGTFNVSNFTTIQTLTR